MKNGDHIGVGEIGGKRVGLYCRIDHVAADHLELWVINGAWELHLYHDGRYKVFTPFRIEERTGLAVIFTDPIPKDVIGDYGRAICYMDEQLQRSWLRRKLTAARIRLSMRFLRLSSAIDAGWTTFRKTYRGEIIGGMDTTDDIAF